MNARVKQFILQNSSDINSQNWHKLFTTWYDETVDEYIWYDDEQIEELFHVLTAINITEQDTEEDRKLILFSQLSKELLAKQNKLLETESKTLSWEHLMSCMNSLLGLTTNMFFGLCQQIKLDGITVNLNSRSFTIQGVL